MQLSACMHPQNICGYLSRPPQCCQRSSGVLQPLDMTDISCLLGQATAHLTALIHLLEGD